ncbi:hypothetical protein HDA32_000026 [Spinactinospora alkalitolerans]|uniref:Uncharacterized protein n=1 Tax=Spinactinospora alkalitolerans TaxID=687207 RepID=A0A852TL17_9ACTN|nr:hypothetical protein [Spinactinospora alkalitolerans]
MSLSTQLLVPLSVLIAILGLIAIVLLVRKR